MEEEIKLSEESNQQLKVKNNETQETKEISVSNVEVIKNI